MTTDRAGVGSQKGRDLVLLLVAARFSVGSCPVGWPGEAGKAAERLKRCATDAEHFPRCAEKCEIAVALHSVTQGRNVGRFGQRLTGGVLDSSFHVPRACKVARRHAKAGWSHKCGLLSLPVVSGEVNQQLMICRLLRDGSPFVVSAPRSISAERGFSFVSDVPHLLFGHSLPLPRRALQLTQLLEDFFTFELVGLHFLGDIS